MLPSNLPNLNACALTWAKQRTVYISMKYQSDYEVKTSFIELKGKIFNVPSGQEIEFKKTGQRSFNNEKIITDIKIDLPVDSVIMFDNVNSKQYRVLNKVYWKEFGFLEYDIMSDYA